MPYFFHYFKLYSILLSRFLFVTKSKPKLGSLFSTVSTGVNSVAAIWYSDLMPDSEISTKRMKLMTLTIGILSYILVYAVPYMGSFVQVSLAYLIIISNKESISSFTNLSNPCIIHLFIPSISSNCTHVQFSLFFVNIYL